MIVPVVAQYVAHGAAGIQQGFQWSSLEQYLPILFGPQVVALLALIAAQVLLAVALALKKEIFDWKQLPNFYKTMVLPLVMGWVACSILAKFATPAVLGPEYGNLAAESISGIAYLAIVASLGSRIITTAKELYGEMTSPFGG
jgi:drug/metabolite transporter (DMT)-like permease